MFQQLLLLHFWSRTSKINYYQKVTYRALYHWTYLYFWHTQLQEQVKCNQAASGHSRASKNTLIVIACSGLSSCAPCFLHVLSPFLSLSRCCYLFQSFFHWSQILLYINSHEIYIKRTILFFLAVLFQAWTGLIFAVSRKGHFMRLFYTTPLNFQAFGGKGLSPREKWLLWVEETWQRDLSSIVYSQGVSGILCY